MKIGIDIDDTIADTAERMLFYGNKYNKEILKNNTPQAELGNIKSHYYLKAIFGWTLEEKSGFFEKFYANILEEAIPNPHVLETLKNLAKNQNELYYISSRLMNVENCDTEAITKNWFKKYDIPYKEIILGKQEKAIVCKQKGIELFIDDSLEHCKKLEENGIKVVLITTRMNSMIDTGTIPRINDFSEILKYL